MFVMCNLYFKWTASSLPNQPRNSIFSIIIIIIIQTQRIYVSKHIAKFDVEIDMRSMAIFGVKTKLTIQFDESFEIKFN